MKCPFCGFFDSKVIDSRPKDGKIKSQELIVVDNKTTITKNQNDTLEENDDEYNSNAEPV